MKRGSTFDSTKIRLQDILREIGNGEMQLPDFQRSWVWDDERIRSLLASVSADFPIGAIMLLERGGSKQFKPRPLGGTDPSLAGVPPKTLILDGQQRLTSLYGPLMTRSPIETRDSRGKKIKRLYYINMRLAMEEWADRDEAIVSVPEDGLVKGFGHTTSLDLSSQEQEFANEHFPLNQVFDATDWRQGYYRYWDYDRERCQFYDEFETEIIKCFEQYHVPVIKLASGTPKEAVCLVFEKVNTGGVALSVFELLTASFAADDFQLRDDWRTRERRLKTSYPVLHTLQSDDFLQSVTLLVTKERRREHEAHATSSDRAPAISCKRRDILRLTVEDYKHWADEVERGLVKAARFLHSQEIFRAKDLPYRTQLIPLAAVLVDLGKLSETEGVRKRIARWYWCGVLGELYSGSTESRVARDLPEVVEMVRSDAEPTTVQESVFSPRRLLTLRTRNSAAYKGLYALLMREGCRDFRTGQSIEAQTFFDDDVDIHHIFPKAWCERNGIDAEYYNSVINKTAISARTNRQIGGRAPSEYLLSLEQEAGVDAATVDQIVVSHRIEAERLRRDDFWGFYKARGEALLDLIEQSTGKAISREPLAYDASRTMDEFDEGPVDWDELTASS